MRSTGGKQPRIMLCPNNFTTQNVTSSNIGSSRTNRQCARQYAGPFRFLVLPPELRNRIYRLIFIAEYDGEPGVLLPMLENTSIIEITFEQGYEEEDRSMTAILQTCQQINNEARTIPLNCNIIRFSDVRSMAELAGYRDVHQLNAVHTIEIDLKFDWECLWCWGMLKLFPKLSYLRLIDNSMTWSLYTHGRYALFGSKIKELRGLTNLEIVLTKGWAVDTKRYASEIAQAQQLAETWKSFVTQPKPES